MYKFFIKQSLALKAIWLLLFMVCLSCSKEYESRVEYRITDSASGFDLRYLDENGMMIIDKIVTSSAEEIWQYDYMASEGDIVFVSANYKDIESAIKVQVLIDGKIYKEAATEADTSTFVTVSGVVPIRD